MSKEYGYELRLDQYRRLCDDVSQMNYQIDQPLLQCPQRLVGYAHYADIFRGLIPLAEYDNGGELSYMDDFPEIFSEQFPGRQKTAAAVLFTGKAGNGKHTADYTFMNIVYDFTKNEVTESLREKGDYSMVRPSDMDMSLEFYHIDASFYEPFSERQLSDQLDGLFDQIMTRAVSRPATLFYFSLGDITRFLKSKKLMPRLIGKLQRFLSDSRARCILTAIFDGEASELQSDAKKPFYILELTPPVESARAEYFQFLTENYPTVRFGMTPQQLTEATEGFTFGEIKQLAAYCMMTVKSEVKRRKMTVGDIRLGTLSRDNLIILEKKTIETYIDMIDRTRYRDRSVVPAAAAPVYAPPIRQESVPPEKTVSKTEVINHDDLIDDATGKPDGDAVKSMVTAIDTAEDLRDNIDRNLLIPANFDLQLAMSHGVFHSSVCSVYMPNLDGFLALCAQEGFADLGNLKAVSVSLGGKLKLHPVVKEELRPASQDNAFDYRIVIREGRLIEDELQRVGHDVQWLKTQLQQNNCRSVTEVYIGACDEKGELIVFRKD